MATENLQARINYVIEVKTVPLIVLVVENAAASGYKRDYDDDKPEYQLIVASIHVMT